MDKYSILKQYYGHSAFRAGQEELIDSILSGRDALCVMPTGGGKSLCYQLPALLLPGITLVVSPLISLMKDQVAALKSAGVPAAYINSSLTGEQIRTVYARTRKGAYKLIYVAPERLETNSFLSLMQEMDVSFLAVDEAHCISQWGQDFRPSYLGIVDFINALPRRPIVAAYTATATKQVQSDILRLLQLQSPYRIVTGFDRPNLYFDVRRPKNKFSALAALIDERRGRSGIVYCATRAAVERVCDSLCDRGIAATRYHAGLTDEERQQNQDDFQFDRKTVMVATNAFGMGIDKSDVRYVIHYNMPRDLESYYQEAGRAGRDGAPASCILLFSRRDVQIQEYLIDNSEAREELDAGTAEQLRRRELERLRIMTGYCATRRCLRRYILSYFGETAPEECGTCANCLRSHQDIEVGREARIILGCIHRTGGHFGAAVIAETLCGADTEKVRKYHMDREPDYGALGRLTQGEVRERMEFLLDEGYLTVSTGPYPVLELTDRGLEALGDQRELWMRTFRSDCSAPARQASSGELEGEAAELFARLRALRAKTARIRGVPAYVVFSDKTLREMALTRPGSMEELLDVGGVGEEKARRYGRAFLAEIAAFTEGA